MIKRYLKRLYQNIKVNIMNEMFDYFVYTFLITITLFIFGITIIKHKNYGQYVRKLGPATHYKKQGTPIFGGVIIVVGALIGFLFSQKDVNNKNYLLYVTLFIPVLMYAIIGFIDDYLKVRFKNNLGLSVKWKLFFQIVFSIVYYFLISKNIDTKITIFNLSIDLGYFYIIFILLMFVSSTNAFNFCDGMDGLAAGISVICLSGLLLIAIEKEEKIIISYILVFIAAILAFICYNHKPAKIFMGDSGSMAIGALICNITIILKIEFLLIIIGGVMIIETLSIIIQVFYYKVSNGKRIFLMAPIHHHFELKGIKEKTVVYIFWLIQLFFTVLGYITYKLYY